MSETWLQLSDGVDAINGNYTQATYYLKTKAVHITLLPAGWIRTWLSRRTKVYIDGPNEGDTKPVMSCWAQIHVLFESIVNRPSIE